MDDKNILGWKSNGLLFKRIETGAGPTFVIGDGERALRAVPDGLPSLHFPNPPGKYPDEVNCKYLPGKACSFQTIFVVGRMPEGLSDEESLFWLCETWDKLFS